MLLPCLAPRTAVITELRCRPLEAWPRVRGCSLCPRDPRRLGGFHSARPRIREAYTGRERLQVRAPLRAPSFGCPKNFDALRLQGETGFREKPGVPASLARALPWLGPAHWDALATAGLHRAAPEAPSENALARLRLSSRKERFLANALNPPHSFLHQGGGQAPRSSSEDPRGHGHTPTLPTAVLPGPELGSPALQ